MRFHLLLIVIFNVFSVSVFGQMPQPIEEVRKEIRDRRKQQADFDRLRGVETQEINITFFELSKEAKMLIAPTKAEKQKYKDFLLLPEAEISKIFSSRCFQIGDVELEDNCNVGIPGHGNFYSFRQKKHFYEAYSDIQLYQDWFVSSGFLTQGIIVSLGEIDLDGLSLQSEGIKFLNDFIPAENPQQADKQAKEIEKGIQSDKYIYSRAAKVVENTAYAMRVIAYRSDLKISSDKPEDIIVVFKVVGRDENGNVTIIWRKLQSKKSPKLETN